MARDDPFAGIRLSEQANVGKLDQRLFAPDPPQASRKSPSSVKTEKPEDLAEAPLPGTSSKDASIPKTRPRPAPHFDLKEEALYKASFLFTPRELEGLEDLKLELSRQLDTKVTKNGLIRAALHMLLEDHSINGEGSYATVKVRKEGS